MINTPVSYDGDSLYPYPQVEDANGSFIFECKDKQVAQEIAKRINMHDELVLMLKDIALVDGGSECIKSKRARARELLEKCK